MGTQSQVGFEWSGRTVLVTGVGGFVGGHLALELVRRGAAVVGIARDTAGLRRLDLLGIRRQIELAHGDVTEQGLVQRVLNDHEVDSVFHLAGHTSALAAARMSGPSFRSNVLGTWSLLEACRLSPLVERVVVTSDASVYGRSQRLPVSERSPLNGLEPLAMTKLCADVIARSYGNWVPLPVAVVRLASVYGPGDLHWHRLIPATIRAVLSDLDPVIGGDGSAVSDWLYVEDAVDGCLKIAEHLPEQTGEAFNLCGAEPLTDLEVVKHVRELVAVAARRGQTTVGPSAPASTASIDSGKARRKLGWSPGTSFSEGLGRSIDWYRDYLVVGRVIALERTGA